MIFYFGKSSLGYCLNFYSQSTFKLPHIPISDQSYSEIDVTTTENRASELIPTSDASYSEIDVTTTEKRVSEPIMNYNKKLDAKQSILIIILCNLSMKFDCCRQQGDRSTGCHSSIGFSSASARELPIPSVCCLPLPNFKG